MKKLKSDGSLIGNPLSKTAGVCFRMGSAAILLLFLMLARVAPAQVLVQDDFGGTAGAAPDDTRYVWSGEISCNGSGQMNVNTYLSPKNSWIYSRSNATPGAGETLTLKMRLSAYAEPGVYGNLQPRGLRAGNDANNVIEFYSIYGTTIGLRARKAGVETLVSYPFPAGVYSMHDYEISVTTTAAVFKVDGIVAGTITNNLPTGALNFYVSSSSPIGNVPVTIDSMQLSLTNNAPPPIPTAATTAATSLTGTSATLNGSGNPNGAYTTGWFRYSMTDPGTGSDTFGTRVPTSSGTALGSGLSSMPYSQAITGLKPGTTYYYCAIAQNSAGTSIGSVLSFTTPLPPAVTTSSASNLVVVGTNGSATFNGTVNPNGTAAGAWFAWGPTTSYGSNTPVQLVGSGSSAVPVSVIVSNLSADTVYHCCLIATNAGGTSNGVDQVLNLPALPHISSFSPASGIAGTAVTIHGTNFSNLQAVRFNGTPAESFSYSSTQIDIAVPAGASSGSVTVATTAGTAVSTNIFTVIQPPVIATFNPTSGPVGTVVTISGSNLATVGEVKINGGGLPFSLVSDSELSATIPPAAFSGLISAINPAGTGTSLAAFQVTRPTVTLTNADEAALNEVLTNGGTAIFNFDGVINITTTNFISDAVTLDGSGHNVTLNGSNVVRLLSVNPGARLTLRKLTLANGRDQMGGAINNNGGFVTVADCVFTNDIASADATGSAAFGGAIFNGTNGTLLVTNCSFLNNRAIGTSGSVGSYPAGTGGAGGNAYGGAIYNAATLIATNCTFYGNQASGGMGGTGGQGYNGYWYSCGLFGHNQCLQSGGPGGQGGAGGHAFGGNVYISQGAGTVVNATIAGGMAAGGSGGYPGSPGNYGSGNLGWGAIGTGVGGNLAVNAGVLTLQNSIVANPFAGANAAGAIADGGNNICSDSTCNFTGTNSFNNTNPQLTGAPADNGGPTPTIAIQYGSPAMNAGNDAAAPATDQRHLPRLGISDIGSFEYQSSDFTYTTNNGAITITGYTGTGGTVTIPSTINGLPVASIVGVAWSPGQQWSNVTSVTIPTSVTTIGDWAFYYSPSLENIVIPDSVNSIGGWAFENCWALTNVTIGSSVTNIGGAAFWNCSGLTHVTMGGSVMSIGDSAFAKCTGLTNIDLPASLTRLGVEAFSETSLASVTIPNLVSSLGQKAFYSCQNLASVVLPDSLTNIDDWAFDACPKLASINLPSSLARIGANAFGRSGLVSIVLPNLVSNIDNSTFYFCESLTNVAMPGSVTNIGNHAFAWCTGLANIVIPGSVARIGVEAFYCCTNLSDISIGSGVANIDNLAFAGCASLTNILIPESVTNLGNSAFGNCSNLAAIYFEGNAPSIGNTVFQNNNIATVYYRAGTTNWGATFGGRPTALWGSAYLLTVNGGAGSGSYTNGVQVAITANDPPAGQLFDRWIGGTQYVANATASSTIITMPAQNISVTATYRTNDFTCTTNAGAITITDYTGPGGVVVIPATINGLPVTQIGISAFNEYYQAHVLTGIVIPDSVTNVGDTAFYACSSLTNVTIGSGLISMGYHAFASCSGLVSFVVDPLNPAFSSLDGVLFNHDQTTLIQYPAGLAGSYVIPGTVTNIAFQSFASCAGLTGVTIPDSVVSIESQAFYSCANLASATLPNSVTNALPQTFVYCTGLTNAVVGNGVTSLDGTFSQCSGLASVSIGNSVTNISGAFVNCSGLKNVLIPGSIVSLGDSAFGGCGGLTNLVIPDSVVWLGNGVFSACASLTDITIPNHVPAIGEYAFDSCRNLNHVTLGTGITNIGNYAFKDCSGLTNLIIPDGVTKLGSSVFQACTNLVSVTIPYSITSISFGAFSSCTRLADVMIPGNVTSIENWAFANCSSLTNVTISTSVKTIGSYAFYNCAQLPGVIIPDSVTSIGSAAFAGCASLTSVSLPANLTTIESHLFNSCGSLTNVCIGGGVTRIKESAFNACSSLTSVIVPNSVTSIDAGAFGHCDSLASITIGSGVTSIGSYAFTRDTSLMSLFVRGNAPSFETDIFDNANFVTVYYLPGTTGWGSTYADRPAVLWNPKALTGDATFGVHANQFGFTISGSSNLVIVVEACTNLANSDWLPVGTNTLNTFAGTNGTSYFSDPQWTNHPGRFYRFRSP